MARTKSTRIHLDQFMANNFNLIKVKNFYRIKSIKSAGKILSIFFEILSEIGLNLLFIEKV